ncbi:MAG: hypothetical protein HYX95_03495 [Chloroflexi bacterium]|nr:hypothetical protein [Chloroflexota bacterium]
MVMKRLHRVETAFQSVAEDEERVRAREFARALVDAIFAVPEARRGLRLALDVWGDGKKTVLEAATDALSARDWTLEERACLLRLQDMCRRFESAGR